MRSISFFLLLVPLCFGDPLKDARQKYSSQIKQLENNYREKLRELDLAKNKAQVEYHKAMISALGRAASEAKTNGERRKFLAETQWSWYANRGNAVLDFYPNGTGRHSRSVPGEHFAWSLDGWELTMGFPDGRICKMIINPINLSFTGNDFETEGRLGGIVKGAFVK
jgi:hypothetical protein